MNRDSRIDVFDIFAMRTQLIFKGKFYESDNLSYDEIPAITKGDIL